MRKPKVEIYRDALDRWRWRWLAKNGQVQADSGQSYADKRDCTRGLERVTGGRVEIRYGRGTDYQQGHLYRWNGHGTDAIFVEVSGERGLL